MIRRLQVRFVCITMSIVLVMLCAIFWMVSAMTRRNMEKASLEFLYAAAADPDRRFERVDREDAPQFPYFVLDRLADGTVELAGAGGYTGLDQAQMDDLVGLAEASENDFGVLGEYSLRYFRLESVSGVRVAFADISGEVRTLQEMARDGVAIMAVSLLVFLGISVLLARWAVRPVEEAWKSQKQFVADASHELKTPLTVIMTNAQMLQSAADPEQVSRRVEYIAAESRQMRDLVEQLLELARSDTSLPGQQMEPVDLSRTAEMCALTFEPVLFERRHTLLCQIAPGLYVRGSRGRLEQLLGILLDNANKYASPDSQVRLTLRRLDKGRCLLEVFSQGEPLTREQCRKVFQRFYRADPARSADGGFGLGLSIAAGIVRQHGGSIWARPEADGNTFAVRLRTLRRPAAP